MKVYYEIWAYPSTRTAKEKELLYKFPVPSPDKEQEVKEYAESVLRMDFGIIGGEVRRVEE